MQSHPSENRVIQLKTCGIGKKNNTKRKVFLDAFLFLLFLNLMGMALIFSYLNDFLFFDRLLVGGFIVGMLAVLKSINKEI